MIEFRSKVALPRDDGDSTSGYDRIYLTKPIQHFDSFYIWALGLADPRPGQRILDVSCGAGTLVHLARLAGLRATGVDFARSAIEAGQAAGRRGDFVVGDAEALPFADESFDRVTNLGSVEHYEHPERGVAEMARVLQPGGRAVILVPNSFGYQHVLYAWRHGRVYDDGQPLQRYGAQSDWRALIESNGLQVWRVIKYQMVLPRTRADVWWYARQPRKLFQLVVSPLVPLNAANCFVYLCRKG